MTHTTSLPHHSLVAYKLALEYVRLVASIRITGAKQREQARGAAASCARNCAEGAGRHSAADKSRVFAIARGECVESIASVEIAEALGECSARDLARVHELGGRLSAVLSRLVK